MSAVTIGILGLIVFIILIFLGMNIGLALFLVGFVGYATVVSPKAAMVVLRTMPATQASNYSFMVIPLFIVMGNFAFHAGLSGIVDQIKDLHSHLASPRRQDHTSKNIHGSRRNYKSFSRFCAFHSRADVVK